MGLWTVKGMLDEFGKTYGEMGRRLLATAIAAGYRIVKQPSGNILDDWDIDDTNKIISLPKHWKWGWDDSNEEAAEQLYDALADNFESKLGEILAGATAILGRSVQEAEKLGIPGYENAFTKMQAEARRIGTALQGDVENELTFMAAAWVGGKGISALIKWARPIGGGGVACCSRLQLAV